jgi:phage shock protein E
VIDRAELQALVARGAQLIEVLPSEEYGEDHLPGARSLPLRDIDRDTASTIERSRPVIVYCWDGA